MCSELIDIIFLRNLYSNFRSITAVRDNQSYPLLHNILKLRILPVDNNSKVSTSEIIPLIYYMHINSNNSSVMTSIKQNTSFMEELGENGTINHIKTLAEYWHFQLKTTY